MSMKQRVELVIESDHRRAEPPLHHSPNGFAAGGHSWKRPAAIMLDLRLRMDGAARLGDDTERAFGADHQLREVGCFAAGKMMFFAAPVDDCERLHHVFDLPVLGGTLSGRACSQPST